VLVGAARVQIWPLWVLSFVAMAVIQNALVLWTHEASHYGFSRNKRLNDLLGDLFVSGPTGVCVAQYRWQHLKHHRHLGDPSEEIDHSAWMCIRGWQFPLVIARHASGWFGWQIIKRYQSEADDARTTGRPRRSTASVVGAVVGNSLLVGLCVWAGSPFATLFLWILPLFTLTPLIGNLRTIVEHQPSSDVCDQGLVLLPPITRYIDYPLIERILVAPVGFAYHYEHHLHPSIPYWHLRAARKRLIESGWLSEAAPVVAGGYFSTLWRLSRESGFGIRLRRRTLPHDVTASTE